MAVVDDIRWIVAECRRRGETVVEVPGWETRGRGEMRRVAGQLNHHDAVAGGPAAGLRVCTFGRPDLRNSLCMFYLGRDGVIYVVAAGVSWHAGRGLFATNSEWSGIEAANDGRGEPWPAVQNRAYATLNGACSIRWGYGPGRVRDHKEHAPRRKTDRAGIDPALWRVEVARAVQYAPPPIEEIPMPVIWRDRPAKPGQPGPVFWADGMRKIHLRNRAQLDAVAAQVLDKPKNWEPPVIEGLADVIPDA